MQHQIPVVWMVLIAAGAETRGVDNGGTCNGGGANGPYCSLEKYIMHGTPRGVGCLPGAASVSAVYRTKTGMQPPAPPSASVSTILAVLPGSPCDMGGGRFITA